MQIILFWFKCDWKHQAITIYNADYIYFDLVSNKNYRTLIKNTRKYIYIKKNDPVI